MFKQMNKEKNNQSIREEGGVGGWGEREVPPLEPEQSDDAPDSEVFPEHLSDRHAGVEQLLAALVTDTRHEGRRLPDQSQLLGEGGNSGSGNSGSGISPSSRGQEGTHRDQGTADQGSVPAPGGKEGTHRDQGSGISPSPWGEGGNTQGSGISPSSWGKEGSAD